MCAEDASKTMKSLNNPHTSIMHAAGVLQVRRIIVIACPNSSPKHKTCKVCGIKFSGFCPFILIIRGHYLQ